MHVEHSQIIMLIIQKYKVIAGVFGPFRRNLQSASYELLHAYYYESASKTNFYTDFKNCFKISFLEMNWIQQTWPIHM